MAPLAASRREATDDEIAMEKNAGLIMGTNNSSIVSKRSVERLYLPQPHFYRYFVKKPQRRAPLINRGYWLRMRAVDWVVRQFLERPTDQKKIIINLGCGYDPIPFQWLAQDRDLCSGTKFVDVDFEELMISKREIIRNTPKMRDLLSINDDVPQEKGIMLDSEEYVAVGCDLRNPRRLERLLRSVVDLDDCLVLCVAEVSITYMAAEDSDALIAWTSTLSPDVTFCLLEQQSPDRPDNPFTATMMKHFAKLNTPLRSVFKYPGCHTQTLRFQSAGFHMVETQNLWELWADPRFLSPSQRMSLDEVEPFDEWEEFALFASHYALIIAQTGDEPLISEEPRSRRTSIDSIASDLSTRTVSPYSGLTQFFAYKYTQNPEREGRTHHASAYRIPGEDAIGLHGGVGLQARLSSTSVYCAADSKLPTPSLPPEDIGARCCHTMTTLANGQNILVGGRGSPLAPMKDCWLQIGSKWERIQDLPEPRFRHRAAAVVLPDKQYGVVVFGGKTSATKVAIDCLLWDKKNGWQKLRSLLKDPMPRFGASFVRLGFNHGLLFGGMRNDGVICQGLWRWRLTIRDGVVAGITFKPSNALDTSAGIWPWLSRLGASYSVIRNELLLVGGVARSGCIPKDYEILSILGSFSAFGEFEKEMELRVACVIPRKDANVPRPFFIGHSTHRTASVEDRTTLVVGGGAICFSFGAYWNPGCWLLYFFEAGDVTPWALIKPTQRNALVPGGQPLAKEGSMRPLISVDCVSLCSEHDFTNILQASVPKILTCLDIGPCISQWTPSYLLSKVPSSRSVVIHAAPSRTMNFQRKDFAYTTVPFHKFIQQLQTDLSAHMYLRSISSTKPTQLPAMFSNDWPEIAPDFHLPKHLEFIHRNQHSSPLRISANVNMWLHYDVMANVLFQIRGTRKLILFPPDDIKHLSFPPGSTTSTIDILEPSSNPETEEDRLRPIPNTQPHVAILRPGEALFIPPLWAHTGTPLPSPPLVPAPAPGQRPGSTLTPQHQSTTTSSDSDSNSHSNSNPNSTPNPTSSDPATSRINISLNIFFRSLSASAYPAGRDVYGNRDLAAYEDGRRDLDKIFRRFTHHTSTNANATNTASKTTAAASTTDDDDQINTVAGNGPGAPDGQANNKNALPELGLLEGIPKPIAKAYLERLADELRERAERL
ncbi:tRNA methyltransferase ppm2 [Exophiala xenobiotica]|nr:tRNA methyltransferase ppm2 [Exophiala xenobiotica]KAK5216359.1 tRNA methyltransferase ppm2 [Exophiala xenobiotica]KAK5289071.1 tRNA methyltransferase ppm2 [Exophiala xenobiotica]KAK5315706.1 tRNA methyltransferase ppm2 [Exophiala xenobiotica]KAK5473646.1 tRNA methyltransferase ppm2 [Exophiala xenobiotica]